MTFERFFTRTSRLYVVFAGEDQLFRTDALYSAL